MFLNHKVSTFSGEAHWQFGVPFHPGHIARLLKKLRWTPQLPLTRALQRDEQAIQHWREQTWPALKKKGGIKDDRLSL